MQNSVNSEKSKGIVVFAFNTATTDYVAIADRTSKLAAHHLGLPVTLVTDKTSEPKFAYDNIIRVESKSGNYRLDGDFAKQEWKNFDRYLAYDLSPYDTTLLMDTDYVVLDDNLLKIVDTVSDYRLMHHNQTSTGPSHEDMGVTSLPFVWATVVVFNKTEKTGLFFNLIGRIQRNYEYYKALYNIRESNYRNDYAFAIANIIINGYDINEDQGIPWSMFTIEDAIESVPGITDNFLYVRHADRAIAVPRQCIHVMDKKFLQSRDFEQVVEAICG
jgi:hypothetical protein